MRRQAREQKEAEKLDSEIALAKKQLAGAKAAPYTRDLDELKKKKVISQAHAAELFGIGARQVRKLVKRGKLNATASGKVVSDNATFEAAFRRRMVSKTA